MRLATSLVFAGAMFFMMAGNASAQTESCPEVLQHSFNRLQDEVPQNLCQYKGKVALVVNTASYCGFTKQYSGLESLYKKYKDNGVEILAFPCNQFGSQEPGTSEDIKEFCSVNFGVSFQLFEKVDVNGDNAHPIYKYLTKAKGGIITDAIKWNFTKFLIDREGNVVDRFAPQTTPESIEKEIEKLL